MTKPSLRLSQEHAYRPVTEFAIVSIVLAAGFIRGVTGFGGSMLMTPILANLVGPVPAVAIALILETAAALVMFSDALQLVRWRTLLCLIGPAALTLPLGGYILLNLDPAVARRLIAAVVVVFSLMLLSGFRYSGAPRPATLVALACGRTAGFNKHRGSAGNSLFPFGARFRGHNAR
jgi:uncharacterized membrane protein YfcA